MGENLRRAIQDLNPRIDDALVALSAAVCSEVRRVNQFSMMGRPSMQTKKNIRALMNSLPKMWGLAGLISGRIVHRRKFQFVFPKEEMLSSIRGIPLKYLNEPVIRNIGDRMGEVMSVYFNPDVNAAVEFVRVRLNWNVEKFP
ncbi:uncharacterized protein LOC106363331 [Brassica napus]|uniref:uncharacterized protein LOC106314698 n=1 Tax=Brassica oleracea var. oleracea TaxID=109376 RepID=UPI0006A6DCFD|nr:PREDICTED: uncharacterized protein LOC106314698 [Brassica oleracea var. oleracea]XP_013658542.1 uncharacterized protein LOC106363331 [Brassica napus]